MTFDQAQANFEKTVKWMQKDVDEFSTRTYATPEKIDAKLSLISPLIDFYDIAMLHISETEMREMEHSVAYTGLLGKYNDLREKMKKLVTLCKLAGLEYRLIDYYTQNELDEMRKADVRIVISERRPEDRKWVMINGKPDWRYEDPKQPSDEHLDKLVDALYKIHCRNISSLNHHAKKTD